VANTELANTVTICSVNLVPKVIAATQGHEDRQQRRLVHQQGDLRFPEQGGGLPLAQHGDALLVFAKRGRVDTPRQLVGRTHDEHKLLLARSAVLFLASPLAQWITEQVLPVNGGYDGA
jgi:NAD(P)-dependent dehydrogenase (short-subunit alcohol dehydrogenase family)